MDLNRVQYSVFLLGVYGCIQLGLNTRSNLHQWLFSNDGQPIRKDGDFKSKWRIWALNIGWFATETMYRMCWAYSSQLLLSCRIMHRPITCFERHHSIFLACNMLPIQKLFGVPSLTHPEISHHISIISRSPVDWLCPQVFSNPGVSLHTVDTPFWAI